MGEFLLAEMPMKIKEEGGGVDRDSKSTQV